jgi:aryl-alcohol dehydrogenase-like predicted oxidoreductase
MAETDEEKRKMTRRDFIKTSSAAGAGIALSSYSALAKEGEEEEPKMSGPFKLRTLGRTKLKVTELSFGGIQIRDVALLHAAIDKGINLVHTAQGYGGGRSIKIFGEVMKTKRDKVFLALKQTPIVGKVEEDLRTLNTDYLDILIPPLHDVKAMSNPELPGAYEKLKKEGKIRFSGFVCHSNMADVMKKAIDLGFFDVMLVKYNINNMAELAPILAEAKEKLDIGFIAMKVVQDLSKNRTDEIPKALKDTIKNKNVDTLLIGMANFDDLNTNVDALAVKKE